MGRGLGVLGKRGDFIQVCGEVTGVWGWGGVAFKTNQSHSKRQTLKFQPLGPHIFLHSGLALHFRKLIWCV